MQEDFMEEIKEFESNPYARYENDVWSFGILLITGKTLVVDCIDGHYGDYIKVTMKSSEDVRSILDIYGSKDSHYFGAYCSRQTAMVRKEHIVMIFEMMDT